MDRYDAIIVGTGLAGLSVAYHTAGSTLILTKSKAKNSNSFNAQGGIAAAIGKNDNPELHLQDTINAGAGLCNKEAARILTAEGPERVRELIAWGCPFDRDDQDKISLGMEGAHSRNRILHANKDSTGAELTKFMTKLVREKEDVHRQEAFAQELIVSNGTCLGVQTEDGALYGPVILATGGYASLYPKSTNPRYTTGDGCSMAFRAGAELMDLEFMQFHPTTLQNGNQCFLISEAVRGEGAILMNDKSERFMLSFPRKELEPRDIVAREINRQYELGRTVFLDISFRGEEFIRQRFPMIYSNCMKLGYDMIKEKIPITPAAHYSMGGIRTDLEGRTTVRNLFSCGEAACFGLHGANRLASNSLLECVVFGPRVSDAVKDSKVTYKKREVKVETDGENLTEAIKDALGKHAGIIRRVEGLKTALRQLELIGQNVLDIQSMNALELAKNIAKCALAREESRGAHYRMDFPDPIKKFCAHSVVRKDGIHMEAIL